MHIRSGIAGAAVAASCVASALDAWAFCRTTTCPLPPSWSPQGDCEPASFVDPSGRLWPDFASYCAALTPPAKVLPVWWRNACVSYDVQRNASKWVAYGEAETIVAAAFAQWTQVACPADAAGQTLVSIRVRDLGAVDCAKVGYNTDGAPNQHAIIFRDDVWPYPNDLANTLGLTTVTFDARSGEIYDADTEINGTVPLGVSDPVASDSYDLASIITHEMGHFLGLAHSADRSATMYAQYVAGSTSMRSLTGDDSAGVCSIYPPNGTRNVSPSVATGGSVIADPCNWEPRHGFSQQCDQLPTGGCAVGSGHVNADSRWVAVFVGAFAALRIARDRPRALTVRRSR
ncbi:MAG TPA: matrixin family metalloprotease [Polyangiaceae bacterium]|nr:matrixin family metalloprotease [Polyangiaceae bacterium]